MPHGPEIVLLNGGADYIGSALAWHRLTVGCRVGAYGTVRLVLQLMVYSLGLQGPRGFPANEEYRLRSKPVCLDGGCREAAV
jgi:hypothetical protein